MSLRRKEGGHRKSTSASLQGGVGVGTIKDFGLERRLASKKKKASPGTSDCGWTNEPWLSGQPHRFQELRGKGSVHRTGLDISGIARAPNKGVYEGGRKS